MVRSIGMGLVLFGLWLLLSGRYEPLLVSLGVASTLLVVFITHRMNVIDHEGFPVHQSARAPLYWLWLAWEIVKANVAVAKIILNRRLPISPVMFRVPSTQRSELGHVIYANSITLTPGTVTVDIVDGMLEVHSLTLEGAAGLETGEMDRRVTEMEDLGASAEASD